MRLVPSLRETVTPNSMSSREWRQTISFSSNLLCVGLRLKSRECCECRWFHVHDSVCWRGLDIAKAQIPSGSTRHVVYMQSCHVETRLLVPSSCPNMPQKAKKDQYTHN